MNNAKMNETLNHINTVKTLATKNPGKCFKVCAGFYYLYIDGILWSLENNPELNQRETWIARDDNDMTYSTYTDPYTTKRELLEVLRG